MKHAKLLMVILCGIFVLFLLAVKAHAVSINTYASAHVEAASPQTVEDSNSGTDDVSSKAVTGWGDEYEGEYSFASVYGDAAGIIWGGAGHFVEGNSESYSGDNTPADGSATAKVQWSDTFDLTNYSSCYFSFNILEGGLYLYSYGEPSTVEMNASYSIDILANGDPLWSSSATLTATFEDSSWAWWYEDWNDNLQWTYLYDPWVSDNYIDVGIEYEPQEVLVDLSDFAGREDVTLTYIMELTASDPSEEGEDESEEWIIGNGQAAWFGDPFNYYAGVRINGPQQGPQPIPEPSTVLLLGCGIAALSALRKRCKEKKIS